MTPLIVNDSEALTPLIFSNVPSVAVAVISPLVTVTVLAPARTEVFVASVVKVTVPVVREEEVEVAAMVKPVELSDL